MSEQDSDNRPVGGGRPQQGQQPTNERVGTPSPSAPPPGYGPGARPDAQWGPPAPQGPWAQGPQRGPWGPAPAPGLPPSPYHAPVQTGGKPQLPSFPHPEPREYHQMLRTWNYAWWKPVLGFVLVAVGMTLVAPLVMLPVLVIGVTFEQGSFWENFQNAATLEAVGPAALLYLNLTLGSAILVCWAVMRWVHRMRPRWLTSVVPKMRWKLLFIFVGISAVALVAQIAVSELMPGPQDADVSGHLNSFSATTALLGFIILLTTPFQAAGEEYVFRGYLMQAIGSFWSGSRVPPWVAKWVAIVGTATLFALAHGVQNFPLFFDRFMFGFIAGWLVVRTGGLEAGIAMHILNNFLAFGYALAFSDLSSTLNVSEVGWENIPVTLTQAGTYAVLVLLVSRKLGVQRRTRPPGWRSPEQQPPSPEPVSSEV